MYRQLTNPKFYFMIAADAAIFALSISLAYLLRFDFSIPPRHVQQLYQLIPLSIPLKTAGFLVFGMYMGMWRYTDLRDSWRLLLASLVATLAMISAVTYWSRFEGYPRSVFVMDFALTFILCGGLRVCIRTLYLKRGGMRAPLFLGRSQYRKRRMGLQRVLIVGAGDAGEKLLREIIENPEMQYEVAGFLDDDPEKRHRSIHGVRVLGGVGDLESLLERGRRIDQVFLAIPTATGPQVRRIVSHCEGCRVEYKILPDLSKIIDGKVSVRQLREVRYEDLLGREPVQLESELISGVLRGKTVLVTGAGGSIGSELCRQIISYDPGQLILVEHSEVNLYAMEMELHHELGFSRYTPVLGSVRDRDLMQTVFAAHRPQVIFHAAAYKHVPLLEHNPWEAVINNVLGSQVVMETAKEFGAERFVLVSTDKAVRPTNVMGASKRITEMLMQCLSTETGTRFMAVRFGNVVGSSGSVIPLFRRQIEHGGPVTVTHPDVTRYFMTISEACQLILQAGSMGQGGEIFVLDMGTPVKIKDMAEDLIRLCGKEPGHDIEITFTGLRPGEKLYEELIAKGEDVAQTRHKKILILRAGSCYREGMDQDGFRTWLYEQITALRALALRYEIHGIRAKLMDIVPEYKPEPQSSNQVETS